MKVLNAEYNKNQINWAQFLTHENKKLREACKQALETNNSPIIERDLDLQSTNITKLPEGLIVHGYLDLIDTKIPSLPKGLTVGGNLYIYITPITELPKDLQVGGQIYSHFDQLKKIPKHLKKHFIK